MGDVNQKLYLRKFLPTTAGPVLEVGSKNYGNTATFRDEFAGAEYVGVDMEAGENVDCVLDLTKETGDLPHNHFALAICCSVLEHVARPWEFAPRLSSLIAPGGVLYMSVPWVWRYHAYPDDYYRFSWRGIMELFPELEWHHTYYSGNSAGDFFPITDESNNADDKLAVKVNPTSPTDGIWSWCFRRGGPKVFTTFRFQLLTCRGRVRNNRSSRIVW